MDNPTRPTYKLPDERNGTTTLTYKLKSRRRRRRNSNLNIIYNLIFYTQYFERDSRKYSAIKTLTRYPVTGDEMKLEDGISGVENDERRPVGTGGEEM